MGELKIDFDFELLKEKDRLTLDEAVFYIMKARCLDVPPLKKGTLYNHISAGKIKRASKHNPVQLLRSDIEKKYCR